MTEIPAKKTLYIVDGSAYIFRAFYAIRSLSNSKGFPTNAIYGFAQMLRNLLESENPDYIAVTFDPFGADETNFRLKIYGEYKANRSEMPEDLRMQIPFFEKVVSALNIPVLIQPGVEADDVIATFCRIAQEHEEDFEVCIVSADKDLMQLLEFENVRMIDTMRNRVFTRDDAIERFGVPPERIKYVMALSGDSSDNIPGVPGIGEKTGGKLVAEFGDLETVLASVDKISGKKRKENLTEFADQARLSLELVTLKTDCDVEFDLDALRMSAPDLEEVTALFTELGLHRPLQDVRAWMKRRDWLEGSRPERPKVETPPKPKAEKVYRTILTETDLDAFLVECENASRVAFDLETTSLNPLDAIIVGVAMAVKHDEAVYIPIGHRYIGAPPQLSMSVVMDKLRPLLDSDHPKVVAQNFKYELMVLERHGVTFRALEWDTMLMSYLLDPGRLSQGLNALAADILDYEMMSYSAVAGKGRKKQNFEMVDVELATKYAAEDADVTLQLANAMEPVVERANVQAVHDNMEVPLSYVLSNMEKTGICVDQEMLHGMSREFERELTELQREINGISGTPLNPNSPTQLREVLFDRLKLPVKRKTKSGPSTDSAVLEELADLHPLPNLILQFRSFSKLKGTYVDALPQLVREDSGRVHSDFNQAVAATGRLSSSNPNLQNIPIRTSRGREIRRAFVPQKDWVMVCADYSQIELRIMAHMAQDPILLHAYQNDHDIHALTASQIFDIEIDDVTREQRAAGKTINFGVMYGMGANRLAKDLDISRTEAKTYIENYFTRYVGVKEFFDQLVGIAVERGYAETMFGRRRLVDELLEGSRAQRAFAERVAVNTPIQGTAADIIKIAMIELDEALKPYRANMLLQVHDELVFETHPDDHDAVAEIVRREMEGVCELDAPLVVDLGSGANWLDAK